MFRTDAINATVALDQPHGIPWQVVVDDMARLLEVDALGQHVGCDEDVVPVLRAWSACGAWGEAGQYLRAATLVRAGRRCNPIPVGSQPVVRFDSGADLRDQVLDRVGEVRKDHDFALVTYLLVVHAFGLGIRRDLGQRVGQRQQFGVSVPRQDLHLLVQRGQQFAIGVDRLEQGLAVVVGGIPDVGPVVGVDVEELVDVDSWATSTRAFWSRALGSAGRSANAMRPAPTSADRRSACNTITLVGIPFRRMSRIWSNAPRAALAAVKTVRSKLIWPGGSARASR